jgi:hypothetical protein
MLVAENCGRGSRVLLGRFGSGTRTRTIPDVYPVKTCRGALGGRGGLFPHKLTALYDSPSTFPVPTETTLVGGEA